MRWLLHLTRVCTARRLLLAVPHTCVWLCRRRLRLVHRAQHVTRLVAVGANAKADWRPPAIGRARLRASAERPGHAHHCPNFPWTAHLSLSLLASALHHSTRNTALLVVIYFTTAPSSTAPCWAAPFLAYWAVVGGVIATYHPHCPSCEPGVVRPSPPASSQPARGDGSSDDFNADRR